MWIMIKMDPMTILCDDPMTILSPFTGTPDASPQDLYRGSKRDLDPSHAETHGASATGPEASNSNSRLTFVDDPPNPPNH